MAAKGWSSGLICPEAPPSVLTRLKPLHMPVQRMTIQFPEETEGGAPQPQGPFVLKESATVRVSRLHAAQYVAALNARPAYFDLLDYFFQNRQYVVAALTTGSSHKDLYEWTCQQFLPHLPFQYSHFCDVLASFRRTIGMPPAHATLAAAAQRNLGSCRQAASAAMPVFAGTVAVPPPTTPVTAVPRSRPVMIRPLAGRPPRRVRRRQDTPLPSPAAVLDTGALSPAAQPASVSPVPLRPLTEPVPTPPPARTAVIDPAVTITAAAKESAPIPDPLRISPVAASSKTAALIQSTTASPCCQAPLSAPSGELTTPSLPSMPSTGQGLAQYRTRVSLDLYDPHGTGGGDHSSQGADCAGACAPTPPCDASGPSHHCSRPAGGRADA